MEMLPSFVVNEGIRLPIGYRFCPTDEELVIHYLKRKAFAHPLPASVIPDFDVFHSDPWSIPGVGDSKEKRYFFSHVYGNVSKKAAGCGYWKSVGKGKQIIASETNQVVGMRKTLVFCEGKLSHETSTQWVMHELRLLGSQTPSYPLFQRAGGDWAVYRMFQRRKFKRKGPDGRFCKRMKVPRLDDTKPSFIDFAVEHGSTIGPPPPSSPCSSEGSEMASNKLD